MGTRCGGGSCPRPQCAAQRRAGRPRAGWGGDSSSKGPAAHTVRPKARLQPFREHLTDLREKSMSSKPRAHPPPLHTEARQGTGPPGPDGSALGQDAPVPLLQDAPSPVPFSGSQPPSSQCLSLTLTPLIGTEGVDMVVALPSRVGGGRVGRVGLQDSGRGSLAWLGHHLFPHPLGTGGGPMLARVPGTDACSPNWFPPL